MERIDQQAYGQLVEQARDFLSGKDTALRETLGADMNRAAEEMDFERAACCATVFARWRKCRSLA